MELGLDFAKKDLLRLCLGAAGALYAGFLLMVMVHLPLTGLGSRCAGFGCPVFVGDVFPSKLGGAASLESAGAILGHTTQTHAS